MPYSFPLTDDEVDVLVHYQSSPWMHALTCNGGMPPNQHAHDHAVLLEPTNAGLTCLLCGRVQTWIPESLVAVLSQISDVDTRQGT